MKCNCKPIIINCCGCNSDSENCEGGAGKSPYIGENGNWYEWRNGEFVDTGVMAGCRYQSQTDFYVSPDGSDETGDGSEENPWNTIQFSVNEIAKLPKTNAIPNLNIAKGEYVENVRISNMVINLLGNTANPEDVKITAKVAGMVLNIFNYSAISVKGVQFGHLTSLTSGTNCLIALNKATCTASYCNFNSNNAYVTDAFAQSHSYLSLDNSKFIGGNRAYMVSSSLGSLIVLMVCSIANSTTVSSLAAATWSSSLAIMDTLTKVTGTITGSQYTSHGSSHIVGVSSLPSCTAAGTTSMGGTAV